MRKIWDVPAGRQTNRWDRHTDTGIKILKTVSDYPDGG